jgi:hypothetical protein
MQIPLCERKDSASFTVLTPHEVAGAALDIRRVAAVCRLDRSASE